MSNTALIVALIMLARTINHHRTDTRYRAEVLGQAALSLAALLCALWADLAS